jgi:hypothetical protein
MNSIAQIKEMPTEVIDTLLKRKGAQHPKEALKKIAGGERMIEILTPILVHQKISDKPALKGQKDMPPEEYLKQKHVLSKQTTSDMMQALGLHALSSVDEIKMDIKSKLVDALFGSKEAWKDLIEREKKADAMSISDVFQMSRKDLFALSFGEIAKLIEDIDDVHDDYDLKRDTKVVRECALTDAKKKKAMKQLLLHRFQKDVDKREHTSIESIVESIQASSSSSGSDGDDTPGPSRVKSPKRKFSELSDHDMDQLSNKKSFLSAKLLSTETSNVQTLMDGLAQIPGVDKDSVHMTAIHTHLLQLLDRNPSASLTELTTDMYVWIGKRVMAGLSSQGKTQHEMPDKAQIEPQPEIEAQPVTPC